MERCAVIVDNRPSEGLNKIIAQHMAFLPGWELVHIMDVSIKSGADYNHYLTRPAFWEKFKAYEHILIFQHDSVMLRELEEDFFLYDYVGSPWFKNAPWATPDRRGGNGGISLRRVEAHLDLVRDRPYQPRYGNEDVYFSHYLPNVAPYEICVKFGVETEFQLGTCAAHAIEKHLTEEQCQQILHQYE